MEKCFVLELGESARDCAGTVRVTDCHEVVVVMERDDDEVFEAADTIARALEEESAGTFFDPPLHADFGPAPEPQQRCEEYKEEGEEEYGVFVQLDDGGGSEEAEEEAEEEAGEEEEEEEKEPSPPALDGDALLLRTILANVVHGAIGVAAAEARNPPPPCLDIDARGVSSGPGDDAEALPLSLPLKAWVFDGAALRRAPGGFYADATAVPPAGAAALAALASDDDAEYGGDKLAPETAPGVGLIGALFVSDDARGATAAAAAADGEGDGADAAADARRRKCADERASSPGF